MQRSTWQVIQFILFLGLGIAFAWLAFRGQDLKEIGLMLGRARWEYVGLSLLLTLAGHWARALRWQLLLAGAGAEVRTRHALVSLLNGYFVNLGVPRLGEITRCGVLNRLSGAPVLAIAGTVVVERAVDVLVLLLLSGLFFGLAGEELLGAFDLLVLQPVGDLLAGRGGSLLILAGLGLLGLVVLYGLARSPRKGSAEGLVVRLRRLARQLWEGLVSALRMRRRGRFLLLTGVIWLSYYSAPLLCLWALRLGGAQVWEVAFAAFLFGSLARTVPLPAGSAGAYHYLVSSVLLVWGYAEADGLSLATLNHAVQTAFYLVAGLGSWVLLVVWQRRMVAGGKE